MNRIPLISVLFFFLIQGTVCAQEKTILIIDADTGNEVDDLYAIVRGLIEPSFKVIGLSSAQWQASQWAVPNTLENSQRLNLEILSYLQMEDIPHPRGAIYDHKQMIWKKTEFNCVMDIHAIDVIMDTENL